MKAHEGRTMEMKDMIELFVSERTTAYLHSHIENSHKEYDMNMKWVDLLKEKDAALAKKYEEHLDKLVELEGDDQKGLYLFGLNDGLQLAKHLENISCK